MARCLSRPATRREDAGARLHKLHYSNRSSMNPSSSILVLTLGSLNQTMGGVREYNARDSILTRLPADSRARLIETRSRAYDWLKQDRAIWQGIRLSEHEFNKSLVRGPDFGGNDANALYRPALDRFEGRLFQTLGPEGRNAARRSQHHVLLLCGLYGLSTLAEPVQRYNCPVETGAGNVAIWTEGDVITDVLLDYIREHAVVRVFDFTATEPRRRLVSWPAIHNQLRGNVFHCFSTVAAGDDALIPFGHFLASYLLAAPAEKLLAIDQETELSGILFREIDSPRSGMPRETERRAWDLADEIERRRRAIIRFLDKAERGSGSRQESLGERVARLEGIERVCGPEARAMRLIMRWRNDIVYRQHFPDKAALSDIEKAWKYLSQQAKRRGWHIEEFCNT